MELDTNLDSEISEQDLELIDEALRKLEGELTGPTGPFPLPTPQPSEKRMQSILKQAKLEAVAMETMDFAARDGIPEGFKGFFDTILNMDPNFGLKPIEKKDTELPENEIDKEG